MIKTVGSGLTKASPLPKKFRFTTKYVEQQVDINPGAAGLPSTYVFMLNGLYDPNITGVGHQPIGYDQMMAMYDHYTVIGARARVTLSNLDTTYQQHCLVHLKDDATTSNNVPQIIENGMCRYTTVGRQGSGNSVKTLQLNCSMKKFFGRSPLGAEKYTGTVSNNPSDGVFLHITVGPNAAVDTSSVRALVEIEYVAILTEPKELAQS